MADSYHDSVNTMLEQTRAAGESTAFDRMNDMGKRCTFCEQGIRCSLCSQGPCRLTEKAPRGVCGIDADGMAMRNFLLQNTMGTATYTYHAVEVMKEELCDGAGFCLAVCPEGALTVEKREAPEFDEDAAAEKMAAKLAAGITIKQTCFNCGRSENDALLFPCRKQGESTWVCVKCLPALIHG